MLFAPKEKGQGLVEYAIILALVAIVVIAVMRLLGPKIGNTFSTISSCRSAGVLQVLRGLAWTESYANKYYRFGFILYNVR
jgi:pilus assembly protein Flp/PilA